MTTRRLQLLSLVLTSLVSSLAWGQSQVPGYAQPSSRQTAGAQASPATTQKQPAAVERGNWFKRLVIGEPEKPESKPATRLFSNQQPSSRQSSATAGTSATPNSASQAGATNQKGNWFQRLTQGKGDVAPQKPAVPQSLNFAQSSRQPAATAAPGVAVMSPPVAAGASKPTLATKPTQPPARQERGNWFQRMVVGDSSEESTAAKTVQFAAPQPSSRQGVQSAPPSSRLTASPSATPSKPTIAFNESQSSANAERPGWLRRLVVGDSPSAGSSSRPTQPAARPSSEPRMMSGLFGPPGASPAGSQPTVAPSSALAQRAPAAAQTPHALPGTQPGSAVIADSLNEAKKATQSVKIEPDSDRSISLTNWISRLHRRPTNETRVPSSNELAPAAVADRSVASAAQQPVHGWRQPNAQTLAIGAGSGDPRTMAQAQSMQFGEPGPTVEPRTAMQPRTSVASSLQASAPAGSAATTNNANSGAAKSLTDWISRPFRGEDNPNNDLVATKPNSQAPASLTAPIRLPAVTETAARPSSNHYARLEPPSAPAGMGAITAEYPAPTAESASPVRFGSNVRLSAGDATRSLLVSPPVDSLASRSAPRAVADYPSPAPAFDLDPAPAMQPRRLPPVTEYVATLPLAREEIYESVTTSLPASETASNPLSRPKIIFNPVAGMNGRGQAMVKPSVHVAHGEDANEAHPTYPAYPAMRFAQVPDEGDSLPPPENYVPPAGEEIPGEVLVGPGPDVWTPSDMPYDGPMTGHEAAAPFLECFYTVLANLNGPRSCPPGIGVENVMNAPFWIDTTQPLQNCRIRADAAADWEFPDRIEYFWAKTPGPKGAQEFEFGAAGGEFNVDYQELSFYIERGTDRFSVGTDLPIRAVDPVVRRNTTGFADMRVTTKTVLLDGKDWQLTQVFHTHIPTGSFRRGTGNGHVSLEPGVAWRYKWSDVTYIHGDLTYWFPIAADPDHSGQMFNYGIAISHIWMDGDKWALMPTLELNAWTILDGRQTLPGPDPTPMDLTDDFHEIDTLSILNIHPGLRWVCDTAGDCGVREFGISSGIAVTEDHWYEEILRLELRWVF